MSTVTVGNVDLSFEEYGQRPPVVLIHGLAGDCSAWNAQIESLEARTAQTRRNVPGARKEPH